MLRRVYAALLMLVLSPLACTGQEPVSTGAAGLKKAFINLQFERPVYISAPDDEGDDVFVIEQRGVVYRFPNRRDVSEDDVTTVLDIRDLVRSPGDSNGNNEEGLLGMAFHPDYAEKHTVYFDYTAAQGRRRNIISEWKVNPSNGTIKPNSERILMEINQPYWNHDGGHLAFGPNGYLYITKGDGGSAGDPKENGQDPTTLLGSILRIDVDARENGKPYGIPDDNPFAGSTEKRPEIFAYGLRNVWRFSFDPKTGHLWGGDVGQNKYEEIDVIHNGGNYGWDIREGLHPFEGDEEPKTKLIDPIHEYGRDAGVSVTGGYVYRGDRVDALQGKYVFGDYGSGNLWALEFDGTEKTDVTRIGQVASPASFGTDRDGELYVCSFDGHIYKFVPKK